MAHRSVDAHVRHHAGNHELPDAGVFQRLLERGAAKAVGKVLLDYPLAGSRADRVMDLGAFRPRHEEGRSGPRRQTAPGNYGRAYLPRAPKRLRSVRGSGVGAFELHAAAGKVIVLDIDDEECPLRHAFSSAPIMEWRREYRCACGPAQAL